MTQSLHYHFVTPEKLFASGEAEMVVIPGKEGVFGVMENHVPFVSQIRPGVIEIYQSANTISERIFVSEGYAETHGDHCTVLAEKLVNVKDIDPAKTEKELGDAKYALEHTSGEREKARAGKIIEITEAMLAASR